MESGARLGIQARIDAGITDDVQIVTEQQRRRNIRHRAFAAPRDMRLGNVSLSAEPNGHRAFFIGATKTENEAVADGGCADKLFARSAGKPNDVSSCWVKGHRLCSSRQN